MWAGGLLLAGIVLGILLSARMDWLPLANGGPAAPKLPLEVPPGQQVFVPVVKATMPAVVNISTSRVVKMPGGQGPSPFMDDPFFRQFFGDDFARRFQIPRERREASLGSGVIVDPSGYIVTNTHVVAKADEIKVVLADKREFTGKVVGTDPKSDIAVIKIAASDLPTIPWGDSDKLEIGEYVLAIGNPFGLNQTVTSGIVSAVGRANVGIAAYEDFIQTDAAINPGNSGGALVNLRGELVGINTAIFSRSGGYMGIGFAVPSGMAREVMQSLIKHGKVTRGWLGVSIQEVTPELAKSFGLADARGALVGEVMDDSPASKAGLKSGDVIVAVNGKKADNPAVLRNLVAQLPIGKSVKIELIRDKESRTVEVTIAEQPKDMDRAAAEPVKSERTSTALRGLEVQDVTPDVARRLDLPAGVKGVVASDVDADSPAAAAGVQRGDVITEINKTAVRNVKDYERIAAKLGKKDNAVLLLQRRGGKLFLVLKP
jgi:serine protease Do